MADKFQMRRDSAAAWSLANPILADGEPGFERDSHRMKIGDGTTPWNALPYSGASSGGDLTFTHTQPLPSAEWVVTHNLGKYPSVTVIDSSGEEVEGEVQHLSLSSLRIVFSAGFSGTASLN